VVDVRRLGTGTPNRLHSADDKAGLGVLVLIEMFSGCAGRCTLRKRRIPFEASGMASVRSDGRCAGRTSPDLRVRFAVSIKTGGYFCPEGSSCTSGSDSDRAFSSDVGWFPRNFASFPFLYFDVLSTSCGTNLRGAASENVDDGDDELASLFVVWLVSIGSHANFLRGGFSDKPSSDLCELLEVFSIGSGANLREVLVLVSTGSTLNLRGGVVDAIVPPPS
jgi:hypothetical protein